MNFVREFGNSPGSYTIQHVDFRPFDYELFSTVFFVSLLLVVNHQQQLAQRFHLCVDIVVLLSISEN